MLLNSWEQRPGIFSWIGVEERRSEVLSKEGEEIGFRHFEECDGGRMKGADELMKSGTHT